MEESTIDFVSNMFKSFELFCFILFKHNGNVYIEFEWKRDLDENEYNDFLNTIFDIILTIDRWTYSNEITMSHNLHMCKLFHNKKLDSKFKIPLFICEELRNYNYVLKGISIRMRYELIKLINKITLNYSCNDFNNIDVTNNNVIIRSSGYCYFNIYLNIIKFILVSVETSNICKILIKTGVETLRLNNYFMLDKNILCISLDDEITSNSELKYIKDIELKSSNLFNVHTNNPWVNNIHDFLNIYDDGNNIIKINSVTIFYFEKLNF